MSLSLETTSSKRHTLKVVGLFAAAGFCLLLAAALYANLHSGVLPCPEFGEVNFFGGRHLNWLRALYQALYYHSLVGLFTTSVWTGLKFRMDKWTIMFVLALLVPTLGDLVEPRMSWETSWGWSFFSCYVWAVLLALSIWLVRGGIKFVKRLMR